ncbi:hypothetical protein WS69_16330 [Burkholderia sp. BDU5]|nr:hypothetical protein WS69_16330 [Burkholderia sp. BDU5]
MNVDGFGENRLGRRTRAWRDEALAESNGHTRRCDDARLEARRPALAAERGRCRGAAKDGRADVAEIA